MLNKQSIRVIFSSELFVDKTYCFNYVIISHKKATKAFVIEELMSCSCEKKRVT